MDSARNLFEDEHGIAVNKLPGELSQGDRSSAVSLIEVLSAGAGDAGPEGRFLAPVHRLDRPASGVLLFAKTRPFFTAMTDLFRARDVIKTYWAVVEGRPAFNEILLRHHLAADRRRNIVRVRPDLPPNAFLSCRLAGESDRYCFLVVRPLTGKQHQIRAQLAAEGLPIKGDVKYGARRGHPDRSIFLHARELSFTHPLTRRPVRITAPPPAGVLWDLFPRPGAGAD
jgi:23S rRNA pseudouridine1911/1915/1917 synthase